MLAVCIKQFWDDEVLVKSGDLIDYSEQRVKALEALGYLKKAEASKTETKPRSKKKAEVN